MAYLQNYTGNAVRNLGTALRDLPTSMYSGPLQMAKLNADLGERKLNRERADEIYAMQKPGMERERDKVVMGNRPADFGRIVDITNPNRAAINLQDQKDGTDPLFQAYANYYGGKMVRDKNTGKLNVVTPDGKAIPEWQMQQDMDKGIFASIAGGYFDPEKGLYEKYLEANSRLKSGDYDPKDEAALKAIKNKYESQTEGDKLAVNDRHLENLYADYDRLVKLGANERTLSGLKMKIQRYENRSNAIRSSIAKEQERQQGLRDFMLKEDYKAGKEGRSNKPGKFNKDTYTLPEDASPIQNYARDAFVTTYDMADKDAQDFLNLHVLPKYRTVVDSIGEDGTVTFGGKKITIETPENLQWLLSNIAASERAKMTQGTKPKETPKPMSEERRKELAAGGKKPEKKTEAPASPKQNGNFRVDSNGDIYEVIDTTGSGRRLERLVMKKPDRQIKSRKITGNADMVMVGDELRDTGYSETVSDNPDYKKYIDTLKKYGLN